MQEWQTAFSLIPWQDRCMVVCLAVIANFILGQRFILEALPRGLYPSQWERKLLKHLEDKLNKPGRSATKLQVRGAFALAYPVFAALGLGLVLSRLTGWGPSGWMAEVVIMGLMLRWRYALDLARFAISQHQDVTLDQLRRYLQPMTGFSTARQDVHGLFRLSAEETAMAFAERIVGAGLWYLLFGLPGAMAAIAVAEAYALLGTPCRDTQAFGSLTRALYGLLFTLPAVIAAMLLAAGALFTPRSKPGAAWVAVGQPALSPRLSVLRVMAAATGIQLGGKQRVLEHVCDQPWVGRGEPKADYYHLRVALGVQSVAVMLWLLFLGCVFYYA